MAKRAERLPKQPEDSSAVKAMANPDLVSVIIPVYNSARVLRQCLGSIQSQTYKPVEVIVVDSNSTDSTPLIAQEYNAKLFQLEGTPNVKRNYGFKQAKGEYIFYLDSDMVLTPRVIEDCVTRLRGDKEDALDIQEIPVANGFWAKCLVPTRGAFLAAGMVLPRFFKRQVLESTPVDENILFGDDYAHYIEMTKAGFRLAKINAPVEHHETTSIMGMYRRYHEAFKSAGRFTKKHGVKPLAPYASANVSATFKKWILTGLFLRDPHHFAGMLIIKAVRLSGALTGTVAGLLGRPFKSH